MPNSSMLGSNILIKNNNLGVYLSDEIILTPKSTASETESSDRNKDMLVDLNKLNKMLEQQKGSYKNEIKNLNLKLKEDK